jgi:hypothetical protein
MNYAKEVATTILNHLGGRKFIAMTGAKDLITIDHKKPYGLRFAIGRNYAGVNCVEITLNEGKDLYNMEFYKQSMNHKTFKVSHKTIKKFEEVYCDQLQELFTGVTGMCTGL